MGSRFADAISRPAVEITIKLNWYRMVEMVIE